MIDFGYHNMDCMEGMKEIPDKFFNLAIVDPPYGDGGGYWSGRERFGEWFDRYRHDPEGGARQAEVSPRCIISERTAANQTEHGVMRTGGTWAEKYAKKSLRGTLPRTNRILTNCSASHVTKSFGGATIFHYRRHAVFSFGKS